MPVSFVALSRMFDAEIRWCFVFSNQATSSINEIDCDDSSGYRVFLNTYCSMSSHSCYYCSKVLLYWCVEVSPTGSIISCEPRGRTRALTPPPSSSDALVSLYCLKCCPRSICAFFCSVYFDALSFCGFTYFTGGGLGTYFLLTRMQITSKIFGPNCAAKSNDTPISTVITMQTTTFQLEVGTGTTGSAGAGDT